MKPRPGVVYILESLKHVGVCKIGRSTRGGAARAAELTKIPGYRGFAPFRIAAEFRAADCVALEAAVKKRLSRKRVRLDYIGCRELFRITAGDALNLIRELNRDLPSTRQRRLFVSPWLGPMALGVMLALLALAGG